MTNTVSSATAGVIKLTRFLGRFPPKIGATLNKEWLPHTMHTSWGRSLTTSHSAHKTAFSRGKAFRTDSTQSPLSRNCVSTCP
jgi:hypothetical protein